MSYIFTLSNIIRNNLFNKIRVTKMSYNDKNDIISKDEWQTRLENFQFKQADMNKLIMNYLVTGKFRLSFL